MRFVLLMLFGLNVHAAATMSMTCVKDTRDRGGDYQSINIERNSNGRFDIRYTFLPSDVAVRGLSGFTLPVNNERVAINLQCVASQIDERVRSCYSDSYDTRLDSSLVSRSELKESFGTTTHQMNNKIELSFFSPTFVQKTISFDPNSCVLN